MFTIHSQSKRQKKMELQQDISVCNISSTYELGKGINSQTFRSGHVNGMKEGSRAL